MKATLEVPIDCLQAAQIAAPYADRLELCEDLSSEGWSPTVQLVRAVRHATSTTIVAMIRPRVAGAITELIPQAFHATTAVMQASLREIDLYAKAGAHSVAIGLIDGDGHIDIDACTRLRDAALQHNLVVAFLRTFDLLSDRSRGVRDLTALGITRVVTAGVRGWNADALPLLQRIEVIREDMRSAHDEALRRSCTAVEIVAAGGVRSHNAHAWLQATPHVHASCRSGHKMDDAEITLLHRAAHASQSI